MMLMSKAVEILGDRLRIRPVCTEDNPKGFGMYASDMTRGPETGGIQFGLFLLVTAEMLVTMPETGELVVPGLPFSVVVLLEKAAKNNGRFIGSFGLHTTVMALWPKALANMGADPDAYEVDAIFLVAIPVEVYGRYDSSDIANFIITNPHRWCMKNPDKCEVFGVEQGEVSMQVTPGSKWEHHV